MTIKIIRLFFFSGLFTFIFGCGTKATVEKYSEVQLGTNIIRVIPYSDQTSNSSYIENGNEVFEYKCGNTLVRVKNHKIKVNGKLHGVFESGDVATIENGKVYVNGEMRFQDIMY